MNKKFILTFASCVTVLDWILILVRLLCFPDHFSGAPPAGGLEIIVASILWVLAFPLVLWTLLVEGDPPSFFFSCTFLFFLAGIIWGLVIDKLKRWKNQRITA